MCGRRRFTCAQVWRTSHVVLSQFHTWKRETFTPSSYTAGCGKKCTWKENSTKQLPLSIFISCSNKLNWNSFQQSLWPTWRGQCDTYIVLDNLCCEAQCLNHLSSFVIQSSKYSDFSLNGWDFSLEEVRCLQNSFQPSGNLGCTRNWISGVVTWGWT